MLEMKSELRQFAETSTFHGLGNAANQKSNSWLRLAWTLAFLLMFGIYLRFFSHTLVTYFDYPVVTNVDYLSTDSMPFPSVTICNGNIARASVVGKDANAGLLFSGPGLMAQSQEGAEGNGGDSEGGGGLVGEESGANEGIDPNKIDMATVSRNVAHQPENMYLECTFDGNIQRPCNVTSAMSWTITPFSYCHTFNSLEISQKYGMKTSTRPGQLYGLNLLINIEEYEYFMTPTDGTGIRVQIHDQKETPNIDEKGFLVAPGTETFVSMKKTIVSRLSAPYAKPPNLCEDTTSPGYQNPLKYFELYSLSSCRRECQIAHQLQTCNCSSHIFGGNNVTECSMERFISCGIPALGQYASNAAIASACACKPTCEESIYEVSLSTTKMPNRLVKDNLVKEINIPQINASNIYENILSLKVFFSEMRYTRIRQQSQYSATSLFGELGGQLGLCLGASMLTICELLQLVWTLCARVMWKQEKVTSIKTVQVS